jgi:hypothetical protein
MTAVACVIAGPIIRAAQPDQAPDIVASDPIGVAAYHKRPLGRVRPDTAATISQGAAVARHKV